MLNISTLAKARLGQWQALPESAGVYCAVDAAGRVWYVGRGKNLRQRLTNHDRLEDFKEAGVTAIAYLPCEDYQEKEGELIAQFNPPLNTFSTALPVANIDGLNPQECVERYCEIKEMVKALEAEAELLKPNVFTYCQDYSEDGKPIRLGGYSVSTQTRQVWEYSPAVTELKGQLKKLEKEEQKTGAARVVDYNAYPVVRIVSKTLDS